MASNNAGEKYVVDLGKKELREIAYIPQPEPLYTVRPRYEYNKDGKYKRGERCSFRIISTFRKTKRNPGTSTMEESIRQQLFGESKPYADFIATGIQLGFNEKVQAVQTFGDTTAYYFFGRAPTTLSLSGVLIDDIDNDWFVRFITAYNKYLRGTKLARNFEVVVLDTPTASFYGAITAINWQHDSHRDTDVGFQIQMCITGFEFYSAKAEAPDSRPKADVGFWEDPNRPTVKVGTGILAATPDFESKFTAPVTPSIPQITSDRGVPIVADIAEPDGMAAIGGYYSDATPVEHWLNNVATTISSLTDSLNALGNKINKAVSNITGKIDGVVSGVNNIASQATGVLGAITGVYDKAVNPILSTISNIRTTQAALKDTLGTITNFPSTFADHVSASIRAGKMGTDAPFLGSSSSSISAEKAYQLLGSTNYRDDVSVSTPPSAGSTGGTSSTADETATLPL